ncbi:malonate decarboxylase acyl carrier protein [Bradyrhizobium sp. GCM10027634]|uniref:malonate decarboxylase acyl carrier protein n=1 Tax=unclassified Bradyrhizobium TaxID=2631580 RepID=UPI00188CFD26|nr:MULTISPECIES: malonate decarboxylase acyl carrier protein [unclassified Bradyrhizobium]MDN5000387.1 malonate decarboxylase acyl carrier protein [Bradyrhizobium sp. WYCCWR 12677]QOZ42854.1 malonate decarboxylase acyl carrier protein [Bradyrhizobium sp. CCBAU 53340]
MEKLSFRLTATRSAGGTRAQAIVGVVASGNLEVLLERGLPPDICTIDIATAAHGFGTVWDAVVRDFVARRSAGGLRISVNDGGARPDTVALRLAQGVRKIEEPEQ